MSVALFTIATAKGPTDRGAADLHMRRFFHSTISCATRPIVSPADLKASASAFEFQQTGAVWARGVLLMSSASIRATSIGSWNACRTSVTAARPGFRARPVCGSITSRSRAGIGQMMVEGTLDGTLLYIRSNLVDRSTVDLNRTPACARCLNPVAEGHRYFAKSGPTQSITAWSCAARLTRAVDRTQPLRCIFRGEGARRATALRCSNRRFPPVSSATPVTAAQLEVIDYGIPTNRPVARDGHAISARARSHSIGAWRSTTSSPQHPWSGRR